MGYYQVTIQRTEYKRRAIKIKASDQEEALRKAREAIHGLKFHEHETRNSHEDVVKILHMPSRNRPMPGAKILESGIDMNQFDEHQIQAIREGLERNLDVSFYAKPEFEWERMRDDVDQKRT